MSPVTTVTNPLERPPAAPPARQPQPATLPISFAGNTANPFAATGNDTFFSSQTSTDSSNVPPERAGLFGAFAGLMDKHLVRYVGYANEVAASLAHSYHPKKHYNPNQWWKQGNPNWFKGLNAATWVYAGLDVFAKAGEAYKRTKADPNSDKSATGMALRTGVDRAIFQTAATVVIPVKIIGKMQKIIDKSLRGKVSAKALAHTKFFGTFLPIPLIAAFVDGGTNMLMDMTIRPLLGTPKHIIDTHGKPDHHARHHAAVHNAVTTPNNKKPPASSPFVNTTNRTSHPSTVVALPSGQHPQADTPAAPLPPVTTQPVPQHHTRSLLHPFAPVATNFLSGDTASPHFMRANIKFNQFAFE